MREARERREPTFEGDAEASDLRARGGDRAARSGGKRGKSKGARGGGARGFVGRLVHRAFVLGLWGALGLAAVLGWYVSQLPPTRDLAIPKRPPNVAMVSVSGHVFANRGAMGGEAIKLDEMPKYLPRAVLAIEDRRFYEHFGLDPVGLARAVVANVSSGDIVQGGSTITQQLAKNLFLTPERTFSRKVQELLLSVWLEAELSKDQILETYLNRVYLGAGTYGVEAAAQRYFGKSARQVTLGEAAILAGLLKAPSKYAPTRNPEAARARATIVLAEMVQAGYVKERQVQIALAEPLRIAGGDNSAANYVADWVMDQVEAFIGEVDRDVVVETTVDMTLQDAAQQALAQGLETEGRKLNASQGALVSIDGTGAVRALVGGRSYAESQYNRAIVAKRQPGSAFKPFVYLAALESGLTADSVRVDAPVTIGKWSPENYDHRYRGPVTLRQALSQSLNTVAAKLAAEVGPKTVIRTAYRLGITSKMRADASIALGTSEVTPLELTTAYVPFANGGFGVIPYVVNRIRTKDGKALYARRSTGFNQVVAPAHVADMNTMLTDTIELGTARRAELPGWQAAGKTGTSQDFRDAWFVGYTANLTTSVWLGNDDNSSMRKATGGSLPSAIWARYMQAAHQGVPVAGLPGAERAVASNASATGALPWGERETRPRDGGRLDEGFLKRLFGG